MKYLLLKIMTLSSFFCFFGCKNSQDPSTWSTKQIDKWFETGDWLNNWNVVPDNSINRKEFAISYYNHKERWNKAFSFLRSNDLQKLEVKRYEIDGDVIYASVSRYLSKNDEDAKFEAHRKYIDIQYVINGKEFINVAPLSEKHDILSEYDAEKDVEFMTVGNSKSLLASANKFFIFFPSDIHRPGLKVDENSAVMKIVVKVRVD